VSRRDQPGFAFDVADVRDLPFADASLAGVVCWYSLIFLAPQARTAAFAELARVVRPGGHLVTAFKLGDGTHRRAGGSAVGLGVEFDTYRISAREMSDRFTAAGFTTVFQGAAPPETPDDPPIGYLITRKI
jgi:SAM-dependent methyltransferase